MFEESSWRIRHGGVNWRHARRAVVRCQTASCSAWVWGPPIRLSNRTDICLRFRHIQKVCVHFGLSFWPSVCAQTSSDLLIDSQGFSNSHERISTNLQTDIDGFNYITLSVHEETLRVGFERCQVSPRSKAVPLTRFAKQKLVWPVVFFEHASTCDFVELVGIQRRGAHGVAESFAVCARKLHLPTEIAEKIWKMSLVEL